MKAGKASRTAQYMAFFRALESTRPACDRLFTDPFAVSFLDRKLATVVKISAFFRRLIERTVQRKIPGALSSGIARTKYIDDLLQQTIHRGVKQVIILGAGFDTRALRLDFLQTVPVIEIDHPDTAALKLTVLRKITRGLSMNTTYWQVDFNKESLQELAAKHALDFSIPTTIIWEGVTNYLTPQAVDSTFAFAEKLAKGSYIIFTYVNRQVLDDQASFFGAGKLLNDLAAIEERWTFGFKPAEVSDYLKQFDLHLLEDMGALEYRDKYLPARKQKGYEFYRVAFAEKLS